MENRTPPETMTGRAPAAPEEKTEDKPKEKAEKKTSKALQEAAGALVEVLTSAGVLDYEKEFGDEFAAFHKAAKSDGPEAGEYEGLYCAMMNEDVTDSVAYGSRISTRKYWAAKLAAL